MVLLVAIVGGIAVVVLQSDSGIRQQPSTSEGPAGEVIPRIIPRPGEGQAPQNAGDRGGWEQVGLFVLILAAMAGIGVVIFRGGRAARAGRAAWTAAAATGRDGAVDRAGLVRPPQPPPDAPT